MLIRQVTITVIEQQGLGYLGLAISSARCMNPCSGASFPHERGSKTPSQLSLMLYLLHSKSNFNAS